MTLDELIHALKKQVEESGIPYPPSTADMIEDVESLIECPFLDVLRRLYTEVGNEGFGPGYGGLMGLVEASLDVGSYDDS